MSMSVDVHFPQEKLPSPDVWLQVINANNFAVKFEHEFEPTTFSGFLPASYNGEPAGFEYFFERRTEQDACVSLVWHGQVREAISGIIAAACLCHLTAGYLVDTEAGETIEASSAISWARQMEVDLQQMLEPVSRVSTTETTRANAKPWWRF